MNDEIKEILEEIDNKIIPNEHWNKIKDYITNLQEENGDYKSRCEKAIEYIEDNTYKSYGTDYMDLIGIKELLNILNGGDEE